MSLFSHISLPERFLAELDEAVGFLGKHDRFRVITHHDADGIASAAILARALIRAGKRFHISFVGNLTEEKLRELTSDARGGIIFADLASSHRHLLPEDVLILDHHASISEGGGILVNPHAFGVDGARDACASVVCFLLSVRMDEENEDSFPYALAGMLGDKQDIGGFERINGGIVKWAASRNDVEMRTEMDVDGESLFEALLLSTDPYFPGYSGDANALRGLFEKLGINGDKKQEELEEDEKRRLISYLAVEMVERGVPPDVVKQMVKTRAYLKDHGITANRLSRLLDAAGRMGHHSICISYALGNDWTMESLESIWKTYQNELLHAIALALKSARDMGNLLVARVPARKFTSNVGTVLSLYCTPPTKAVIVYACEKGLCHISARCHVSLADRGVDLGKAMSMAADFGGSGGGHRMAAGATVPEGKMEDFLNAVAQTIKGSFGG